MEKQPIPQSVQADSQPADKTAGTTVSAPPFQLQASPVNAAGPIQRETGKQEELQKKAMALSAESGISEAYLKEKFKSPDTDLTADLSRLVLEMEKGKTAEDAGKELLSAIEVRFIKDPDSSSLDLLGAKKSKKYRDYDFHHLSYPGNPTNKKKPLAGYPMEVAEEVESLKKELGKLKRQKKKEEKNVKRKKKGASEERVKELETEIGTQDAKLKQLLKDNPDVAKAFKDEKVSGRMRRDMNKIRGERRANRDTGFMGKGTFKKKKKKDQGEIIDYLNSKMKEVPGEKGKFLREEAADAYVQMRDDAKKHGVELKIKAASRSLAAAQRSAKGGNAKATGSWSVHTFGLAIDLYLNTSKKKVGKETSTTSMKDVVKKRESAAHKWLFVKGAKYGYYPLTNEPWHWEYNPPGFTDKMKKELEAYQDKLAKEAEKADGEGEKSE